MAKKFTLLLKRLFSSTVNAVATRAADTSTIATVKLMDGSAMGTIHGTLDAIPISEKIQSLTDQEKLKIDDSMLGIMSLQTNSGMSGGSINSSMNKTNSNASIENAAAAAEPPKTEFRLVLEKFDPTCKAKVIREIKQLLPQLNLVEAKAFVESAPKVIMEKVKKEDGEKIKKTLEELGATITLN